MYPEVAERTERGALCLCKLPEMKFHKQMVRTSEGGGSHRVLKYSATKAAVVMERRAPGKSYSDAVFPVPLYNIYG